MATSSTKLSAPQQAQVAAWSQDLRAYISMKAKLTDLQRNMDAAYLAANVGVKAIIDAGLVDADVIDDGSGLVGIGPFSVAAVRATMADLEFDRAKYDNLTQFQTWAIICGPANL